MTNTPLLSVYINQLAVRSSSSDRQHELLTQLADQLALIGIPYWPYHYQAPLVYCVSGISHYGGVKFFEDGDLANSPQQEFSPNSRPQIGT